MIDTDVARASVEMSHSVIKKFQELGYRDVDLLGQLGADLGDLYTSSARLQQILSTLLDAPAEDRDRIGDILADLMIELEHMKYHIDSSLGPIQNIEEDFEEDS